jgi:glucose/arabinose dehydrogenase
MRSSTRIESLRMRITTSLAALVAVLAFAAPAGAPPIKIVVPGGFKVSTFAAGLEHPTAMAWGPDGRLYVTEDTGLLVAARRGSRKPVVVARGLRTPLGLAWRGRTLYVSEQGRLGRYRLQGSKLTGRKILVRGLPFELHQQDNVVVGPAGRLYLGSGSTCDACKERNPRSATILSMKPDGTDVRVVARGLRNPFGLAFKPGTNKLYASVNGQDELGTKARPEPAEMVVLVKQGAFYGWPRCWPSYAKKQLAGRCRGVTVPVAYLEPHSSADGIAFWRGGLFVALWGQYLSDRHGRKLVRVDVNSGKASTFARGFDHPLALVVDKTGALLVADWGRGVIYRIQSAGG